MYGADTLDRISKLWATDATTTVIAQTLRIPHGSVCRLIRTARLSGDERFKLRDKPPRRSPPKPEHRVWPTTRRAIPVVRTPPLVVKPLHPNVFELGPHQCKYPITDGAIQRHLFCAAPRSAESPYCAEHKVLCSTGVYVRRRHR